MAARGCCGCGVARPEDPPSYRLSVDVHTHILPREWGSLKDRYKVSGWLTIRHNPDGKSAKLYMDDGTFFRDVSSALWDDTERLADMDRMGIDVQVLSTVPIMFSYWAPIEAAADWSRTLNDHIMRIVDRHPLRFVGLGTIPMQDPAEAARELRRCRAIGLAGVQIGTHVEKLTLGERCFDAVWAAAEETDCAVFVHPWDMMGGDLMKKYFLPWLVGMPAETSLAICSMIFSGVFVRFPRLKVCFAHGGGAFPCTWARVQHGFKVRPDLCAKDCSVSPADQLGRFWTDSLVHDGDTLNAIVKLFGPRRVCLGSDAPFVLGEVTPLEDGCRYSGGELVRSMSAWSAELRDRTLCENAMEWLGMRRCKFFGGRLPCRPAAASEEEDVEGDLAPPPAPPRAAATPAIENAAATAPEAGASSATAVVAATEGVAALAVSTAPHGGSGGASSAPTPRRKDAQDSPPQQPKKGE